MKVETENTEGLSMDEVMYSSLSKPVTVTFTTVAELLVFIAAMEKYGNVAHENEDKKTLSVVVGLVKQLVNQTELVPDAKDENGNQVFGFYAEHKSQPKVKGFMAPGGDA